MSKKLAIVFLALTMAWGKVPRPLPDIVMPMPDGKRVNIPQFKGKVMAIMLFSTTCAECVASIDLLAKLQKQFAARGFQALAAAVNIDAPEQIKGFVERYRPPFPTGHLGQTELIKFADLKPLDRPYVPIFMFVDKHGTIRFQYNGDDPIMKQQEKATTAIVDSLLKAN